MSSLLLPRGIGKGKLTAIVAGVGLAAGAAYWLTHNREEPAGRWTEKIEAERVRAADAAHTR